MKQINTTNIKRLHLLHTFNLGKDISSLQTGPIVVDGIMYFTTDTMTYAINAATGKLKWKSGRPSKKESQLRVNRGVAFYDNKLFRGSGDGHVYALDATDGKQLWQNSIGLPIGGGVISYAVHGKQHIAIVAGMRAPEWPSAPKKSEVLIYGL